MIEAVYIEKRFKAFGKNFFDNNCKDNRQELYNKSFIMKKTKNTTVRNKTMKRLLVKALKNKFDMAKEDAVELAKTVEGIFNGKEEIEDMSIDKYVRSLFYELQREKLLKIRREELKEKGKITRKYYWSFDEDIIRQAAYEKTMKETPYAIYKKIPKNAWLTQSNYT